MAKAARTRETTVASGVEETIWCTADKFPGDRYVVCLIDLLNQKKKLKQWDKILATPLSTDFVNAFNDTVGAVQKFTNLFKVHFNDPAWNATPQEEINTLPEQKHAKFIAFCDRCKASDLSFQQFSDTFVFYSPIKNSYGDTTLVSFMKMLGACCLAMINSLANGIPLRGALCVGTGIELAENTFYGPALAEAHILEQKAEYPRIVISDEASGFLRGDVSFSSDCKINYFMRRLADICGDFLGQDDDGKIIVDYLGEGIHAIRGNTSPDITRNIEMAYRFVRSELVRLQRSEKKEERDLVPRYELLRKYMEDRLAIWGLQSLKSINP